MSKEKLIVWRIKVRANEVVPIDLAIEDLRLAFGTQEKVLCYLIAARAHAPHRQRRQIYGPLPFRD
jgi:hypothetical protein